MAESKPPSQIHPGKGLGWIILGASLHSILTRLKSQPQIYPQLDLTYSSSEPINEPVVVVLKPNGIRLRFDGPDQRLRLIEVLDFSQIPLTYKNIELVRRVRSSEGPGSKITVFRGPPSAMSTTGSSALRILGNMLRQNQVFRKWLLLVRGKDQPIHKVSTISPFLALSARNNENAADEIEQIKIFGAGRLELRRRTSPPVVISLSETTPQDLVAELGPPDAIFRKNDSRIAIHAGTTLGGRKQSPAPVGRPQSNDTNHSSTRSYTEESDSEVASAATGDQPPVKAECFYNYFNHGFDALVSFPTSKSPPFPGQEEPEESSSSGAQLVVTKLLLHANVPGSYSFNRHRRSRWIIDTGEISQQMTSEMPFGEISAILKRIWHNSYTDKEEERSMQRGMVLNRGWGESPESSIELLGGFEESSNVRKLVGGAESVPGLSNTELLGFPGLLFEVLKNDTVSCLTVY